MTILIFFNSKRWPKTSLGMVKTCLTKKQTQFVKNIDFFVLRPSVSHFGNGLNPEIQIKTNLGTRS